MDEETPESTTIGPITTQTVDVEGLAVRYATSADSGSGLPILMTAPWPESLMAFHAVWEKFAAAGRIIALDLPGFGRSQGRADLMSPAAMGSFLIRIMEALGLEKVHAVVPDVGTLAALFAASRQPDRFATIVGGSGGADMALLGEPLAQIVGSTAADFEGVDGGAQVVSLVRDLARVTLPEAVLEDYRLSSLGDRWNRAAEFVRAYPRDLPRLAELLPSIAVPVLVLSGSGDPFVPPSNGEFLRDRLQVCEAREIDAGHFVWEDAADEYSRQALSWISSH